MKKMILVLFSFLFYQTVFGMELGQLPDAKVSESKKLCDVVTVKSYQLRNVFDRLVNSVKTTALSQKFNESSIWNKSFEEDSWQVFSELQKKLQKTVKVEWYSDGIPVTNFSIAPGLVDKKDFFEELIYLAKIEYLRKTIKLCDAEKNLKLPLKNLHFNMKLMKKGIYAIVWSALYKGEVQNRNMAVAVLKRSNEIFCYECFCNPEFRQYENSVENDIISSMLDKITTFSVEAERAIYINKNIDAICKKLSDLLHQFVVNGSYDLKKDEHGLILSTLACGIYCDFIERFIL